MDLADRLLFRLEEAMRALLGSLWRRFLGFSLIGKGFAVALTMYVLAWSVGELGLDALATDVAGAAWLALSLVITAVIIRHIWLRFTRRSRHPTWY